MQDLYGVAEEKHRLAKDLKDSELAISTADSRLKLLQEDLEQARLLSQEYERAQEHCADLEHEVAETRGLLNDKDREICQLNLVGLAQCNTHTGYNYMYMYISLSPLSSVNFM